MKFVTEWIHADVPVQWPSTQQPGEPVAACRNRTLRAAPARRAYETFKPDAGTTIRTFKDTGTISDSGVVTVVENPWGTSFVAHVAAVVEHYP